MVLVRMKEPHAGKIHGETQDGNWKCLGKSDRLGMQEAAH